ncbi:hypothetical protein [Pedobacter frigidisoli]|uniref:hypothetical protein n=1 Tax=Pedobacter frigidisoli TaxID=2530455 RepID=UPI00292E3B75|nr:hypothetical protein [Pedobacter frigidisoli]
MSFSAYRFVIMMMLLTAFAGRIAVYALIESKFITEVSKNDSGEKQEKEDSREDKIKIADILVPVGFQFKFINTIHQASNLFANNFNLTICHLPILIQPPKSPAC